MITEGLESYSDSLLQVTNMIVKLPTTQKEFEARFSLTNDEICIDSVQFNEPDTAYLLKNTVALPTTREEYTARFVIDASN